MPCYPELRRLLTYEFNNAKLFNNYFAVRQVRGTLIFNDGQAEVFCFCLVGFTQCFQGFQGILAKVLLF